MTTAACRYPLGASSSGRTVEAAGEAARLQAEEFDAHQAGQVALSAGVELVNGGGHECQSIAYSDHSPRGASMAFSESSRIASQ